MTNDFYYYSGDTDALLPIGDRINQDISATALMNLTQITWITDTKLADGRLALGALLPFGHIDVKAGASAFVAPGLERGAGKEDEVTAFGDPVLAASLGWKHRDGDEFRAWNLYSSVFVPVGSYQKGRIANTGSNRWGLDIGTGFTLGNFKKGREFSGVLGFTFNGKNLDTDYKTGIESHLELAYKQHLPVGISAGVVGYAYQQLTGDSGGPNQLGGFKGRVFGLGPELGYQLKGAGRTIGMDLRWYHELGARNRIEGNGVFFTLSVPLQGDAPKNQ